MSMLSLDSRPQEGSKQVVHALFITGARVLGVEGQHFLNRFIDIAALPNLFQLAKSGSF